MPNGAKERLLRLLAVITEGIQNDRIRANELEGLTLEEALANAETKWAANEEAAEALAKKGHEEKSQ